jgi:hypothetical protein
MSIGEVEGELHIRDIDGTSTATIPSDLLPRIRAALGLEAWIKWRENRESLRREAASSLEASCRTTSSSSVSAREEKWSRLCPW